MEIKTLGDVVIYLGAVAAAVAAIAGIIHYVLVKPLRRWIREQVKEPLEKQVSPNGGLKDSTRHLIEEVYGKVSELTEAHEESRAYAQENRDLATAAMSLAQQTSNRLDRLMESQIIQLEEK